MGKASGTECNKTTLICVNWAVINPFHPQTSQTKQPRSLNLQTSIQYHKSVCGDVFLGFRSFSNYQSALFRAAELFSFLLLLDKENLRGPERKTYKHHFESIPQPCHNRNGHVNTICLPASVRSHWMGWYSSLLGSIIWIVRMNWTIRMIRFHSYSFRWRILIYSTVIHQLARFPPVFGRALDW